MLREVLIIISCLLKTGFLAEFSVVFRFYMALALLNMLQSLRKLKGA